MSIWSCATCQYQYDSSQGDVTQGVMQGTDWNTLPEDWSCPQCGAPKFEFSQTGGGDSDGSGWIVN
jgi:rubredoxin